MGVPVNSLASPRFCGVRTFQRLPHSADCSGNDFAVLGVPFDTATSYRPGCRFGPAAIRDASSILKSYHSVLDVDIFEHCQGVDAGDVDIIPGYLDESFERIEAAVAGVLDAGAVPVIMGGDHSISIPVGRALEERLVEEIRRSAPDIILTHDRFDVLNPDHNEVSQLVFRCSVMSNSSGVLVEGTKATRQMGIFGFEPHQTELSGYKPGCFIDITQAYDRKVAAMNCFQAQSHLIQYYTDRATMPGGFPATRPSGTPRASPPFSPM